MSKERNMSETQPDETANINEVTTDETPEVTNIPEPTEASTELTDPNT
ncbi:hypothetical protein [Arsukibacterium perlucidum]|nr:hypothetical protein [Arsukibacterium perlucidum]